MSLVLVAVLTWGCNENSLHSLGDDALPPPLEDGGDEEPAPETDDDDDSDGAPYEDEEDDDDVGLEEPPAWREDCPPEALSPTDFYGPDGEAEIAVLSTSPTEATGTLVVPVAGLYAVYDTAVYESGASQTNETGYIRIRNPGNPQGLPAITNCGDEFIVQDSDNSGIPPAPLAYLGTFELVEGDNALTLHHFCPLYLQGQCEQFHIGDPSEPSSCYGQGPNSIHLVGDAICLVPR
jgi:hypothetical protein